MALRVETRYPGGSGRILRVQSDRSVAAIEFAAEPHGGIEALWFCFRAIETKPGEPHPDKLSLALRFSESMSRVSAAAMFRPVYQPVGKNWFRMSSGAAHVRPDGRADLAWSIPYPEPATEVAFCYPYGMEELETLVRKSGGFWNSDEIGLTQEGRTIIRLASEYGAPGSAVPGVYLVARQHAGETPGSWVLDGLMDRFSRERTKGCVVWAVPLMDTDGAIRGAYGRDRYPRDMDCSWGNPPMRHETLVVQEDIRLWMSRCKPALVLDLHAQGEDADGVLVRAACADDNQPIRKDTSAWANLIADHMGREFAADRCIRTDRPPRRWQGRSLCDFAADPLGVPSLAIEAPYTTCAGAELTQKQYREIGRRIGKAVLTRFGQASR